MVLLVVDRCLVFCGAFLELADNKNGVNGNTSHAIASATAAVQAARTYVRRNDVEVWTRRDCLTPDIDGIVEVVQCTCKLVHLYPLYVPISRKSKYKLYDVHYLEWTIIRGSSSTTEKGNDKLQLQLLLRSISFVDYGWKRLELKEK